MRMSTEDGRVLRVVVDRWNDVGADGGTAVGAGLRFAAALREFNIS